MDEYQIQIAILKGVEKALLFINLGDKPSIDIVKNAVKYYIKDEIVAFMLRNDVYVDSHMRVVAFKYQGEFYTVEVLIGL